MALTVIVLLLTLAIGSLQPAFLIVDLSNVRRAIGWLIGVWLLIILPLWLLLRIIDSIFGGPARRKARQ